jgi:hypothetical protein
MFSSQCGNIPFPRWESSSRFSQTIFVLGDLLIKTIDTSKSLHPSRQSLEKPLNKGKLPFYISLDPSRHLSHISPVSRTLLNKEENIGFNTLKKSTILCGKTCI